MPGDGPIGPLLPLGILKQRRDTLAFIGIGEWRPMQIVRGGVEDGIAFRAGVHFGWELDTPALQGGEATMKPISQVRLVGTLVCGAKDNETSEIMPITVELGILVHFVGVDGDRCWTSSSTSRYRSSMRMSVKMGAGLIVGVIRSPS
jgi:hypothetical protein